MEIETLAKIVALVTTALTVAIGAAKFGYDIRIGHLGRRREELKSAKEFLDAVAQEKTMHPYILEKGYQTIAGSTLLSVEEIEYLLELENADLAIKDRLLGRKYLKFDSSADENKFTFTERFTSPWLRKLRLWSFTGLYFIFSICAFAPFIFDDYFKEVPLGWSLFFIPYFGAYACFFIVAAKRIYRAEVLVATQKRYPQNNLRLSFRKMARKREDRIKSFR